MQEAMPDRMPEDLPVTKRIDVMVGITRSKVIWVFAVWFDLKNNYIEIQWQTAFVLTLRCVDVRASFSLANLGVFLCSGTCGLWSSALPLNHVTCTARALHRCPTQQNLDFGSHTPH